MSRFSGEPTLVGLITPVTAKGLAHQSRSALPMKDDPTPWK
jgi:hypothetical protein